MRKAMRTTGLAAIVTTVLAFFGAGKANAQTWGFVSESSSGGVYYGYIQQSTGANG